MCVLDAAKAVSRRWFKLPLWSAPRPFSSFVSCGLGCEPSLFLRNSLGEVGDLGNIILRVCVLLPSNGDPIVSGRPFSGIEFDTNAYYYWPHEWHPCIMV